MLRTASAPTGRRAEPDVGEMFGRYRLEEQLGAGGVGEVWRAFDTSLEREVAIKTLLPRYRDDPDSAARFHREARLAARLRHPHIVRVHDFGEIERRLYLDMELIKGVSVAAALAGGPLEVARAARIVEVVADALDTAHALDAPPEQRMVHRDVKPANILLEPHTRRREHPYLVDFGVARTVAAGPRITGVGAVIGTPAYMAPELWEGRESDHRVDVYALAVTAFELLTGVLPYPRTTVEGLVTAHLTEPPPALTPLRGELPPDVDGVVARGMAKDPAGRFATAGEFADALLAAVSVPAAPGAARDGRDAATGPPDTITPPPADARGPRSRPDPRTAEPTLGTRALGTPAVGTPALGAPTTGTPVLGMPRGRPGGGARVERAPDPSRGSVPSPPAPRGSMPGPTRIQRSGPPAFPTGDPSSTDPHAVVPPARRPYLASPPHFAGLAATVLLVPLYLTNLVPADGVLLAVAALLYALGAVLTALLRRS